jgi:hypothetical protein
MPMSSPATEQPQPQLGAGARAVGVVSWSAFLAAAVATMLCFAFVDPEALAAGEPPGWWTTRTRVYAIGFFFFWLVGLMAASLSWYLTRPETPPTR